jgi:hypothetical protein
VPPEAIDDALADAYNAVHDEELSLHRVLRHPKPLIRAVPRCRRHRSQPHQDQKPANEWICERFHRTVLDEFYRVAFRKKIYRSIDELQADLDTWLANTIIGGLIRAAGASAKYRCTPSLTRSPWRRRNSW